MYQFLTNPIRIILIAIISLLLECRPLLLHAQSNTSISFAVKKEGTGRPIIFIHGLDCSGEVWNETVKHYSGHYTCYSLTLPGFAGQPPIATDSFLPAIVQQLALYIRQEKLVKPIIVGHSLGGWLALDFAIHYPDLAGDLVIVSSAPFLPALSMGSGITADSAGKMGLQTKKYMSTLTPAQVRLGRQYIAYMVRDSARLDQVLDMSAKSDQPTQGEVMYELYSTDLRPLTDRIQSRILALGDWIAYKDYGATHESMNANLQEQYKKAAHITIAINDSSRHFIMYDEPAWMYNQIDHFLAAK